MLPLGPGPSPRWGGGSGDGGLPPPGARRGQRLPLWRAAEGARRVSSPCWASAPARLAHLPRWGGGEREHCLRRPAGEGTRVPLAPSALPARCMGRGAREPAPRAAGAARWGRHACSRLAASASGRLHAPLVQHQLEPGRGGEAADLDEAQGLVEGAGAAVPDRGVQGPAAGLRVRVVRAAPPPGGRCPGGARAGRGRVRARSQSPVPLSTTMAPPASWRVDDHRVVLGPSPWLPAASPGSS